MMKCSFTNERITQKNPHKQCQNPAFELSPVDGRPYCSEDIELGPLKLQARAKKVQERKLDKISKEKKRLAEENLELEFRLAQSRTKKHLSDQYWDASKRATQVVIDGTANVLQAVRQPPLVTYQQARVAERPTEQTVNAGQTTQSQASEEFSISW